MELYITTTEQRTRLLQCRFVDQCVRLPSSFLFFPCAHVQCQNLSQADPHTALIAGDRPHQRRVQGDLWRLLLLCNFHLCRPVMLGQQFIWPARRRHLHRQTCAYSCLRHGKWSHTCQRRQRARVRDQVGRVVLLGQQPPCHSRTKQLLRRSIQHTSRSLFGRLQHCHRSCCWRWPYLRC